MASICKTVRNMFQVGVVQKKDPMGSDKRWFVDNGLTQGFLPCHVLTAFGETTEFHSRPEPINIRPEMSQARQEAEVIEAEMPVDEPDPSAMGAARVGDSTPVNFLRLSDKCCLNYDRVRKSLFLSNLKEKRQISLWI